MHGLGASWRSWSPATDDLARERAVLAIDLLGFGDSRAGLIHEYAIVTRPVLVGGTSVFIALDNWIKPEPGGDPDVSRRRAP